MTLPSRSSHLLQTDLLVAGGGLAGVCAALAAARGGARVVLVQDRSVLGGNASSEIRMHACGADCHGRRPGLRESGIIEELTLEDAARNPHRSYSQWDLLLYEKVRAEPNLTLLLDTDVVGAETETLPSGRVVIRRARAVRNSTEDEFWITARIFADCTGDGRLGAEAGADHRIGREAKTEYGESLARDVADQQTLGSSILLTARLHSAPQPFFSPAWVRKFTARDFQHRPITSFEYGFWWAEWGGQLDTIKDNEVIRHELLRVALGIWDYIKNSGQHPEAQNWALDWVGTIPGKRESRRFLGTHILTETDVRSGRVFDDAVAYGGWPIDIHPPSGVDVPDEPPYTPTWLPHIYTIPAGSLHSRNVANLLFAGRNISATHVAFASTRVMKTCATAGQAIGTMAAVCLKETPKGEIDFVRDLDRARIRGIQQQLIRDDAFIPTLRNQDASDLARTARITASSSSTDGSAERVIDGITRDLRASFGPWSSDAPHAWASDCLPATLRLELPTPALIATVEVTFDSGFERQLCLSPSDYTTKLVIRGPQPEITRHYRIAVDGVVVAEERANLLRKRVHRLAKPVSGRLITLECLATHGAKQARVFEFRIYGP